MVLNSNLNYYTAPLKQLKYCIPPTFNIVMPELLDIQTLHSMKCCGLRTCMNFFLICL